MTYSTILDCAKALGSSDGERLVPKRNPETIVAASGVAAGFQAETRFDRYFVIEIIGAYDLAYANAQFDVL